MATWFGRVIDGSASKAVTDPSVDFHQSCLNELARSLSQVNKAVDEKVSITIIRLLLHFLSHFLITGVSSSLTLSFIKPVRIMWYYSSQ